MGSLDNKIVIRSIKDSDIDDLHRNIYSQSSLDQVVRMVKASINETKKGHSIHLVAEVNYEIVGNMKVEFNQNILEKHRGTLFDIVVNTNFQRRGIARLLLSECKKQCLKKGLSILEVSVRSGTPAENVYKKLGFTKYGELPDGLLEPWGSERIYNQSLFYSNIK